MTSARTPLPDEDVPVELIGKAVKWSPSISFIGRATMTFPPREGDGRRIEWTSPKLAHLLTSEPYNRAGQPPLFRIAEDLRPQNLNIDQRVIEAVRRHAATIAAILRAVPEEKEEKTQESEIEEDPLGFQDEPVLDPVESDLADLESLNKDELLEFARRHQIAVDQRQMRSKLLETIQQKVGARVR